MKNLIMHNLNKAKGQFVAFGIVMIITSVILNSALVLLFQTADAYDSLFDKLHTANISVAIPTALSGDMPAHDLETLDGILDTDTNEALFAQSTLQDFQNAEFTMNTFFYPLDSKRKLSQHLVVEQVETADEMSVYIPLYLSALGGYQAGETIRYVIDGREYAFTVKGIINEMQYGNYGSGFIGLFLTKEAYDRLKKDDAFTSVCEYLIETEENADLITVRNAVGTLLKEEDIPALSILDCQTTKTSRTMVSNTIVLFLAVFAMLVLLISIALSRFHIKNTIDEEIVEMGVLKGIGYTSSMLKFSQVIPYLLVCGVGLVCGVALSYAVIPVIANVLAVQSGFSYTPVFDITAALITISSILVTVFAFALSAAGKIKKLEPVNAIRGINPFKPAGRNHFPLDSSTGSIFLNLILKQTAVSAGRNLLLFAVAFVMMILLTFTSILLYNVNIHPEHFLTTLSEELPDIRVQAEEGRYDLLKEILQKEHVKAVNYGIATTEYADGSIPTIVCEDYALLENNIAYSGRHPQKANEIAVGSAFADQYAIGDTFMLLLNRKQHEYTITGFIQSVNNNGLIAEITDAGYAEISDSSMRSLNLYLPEDADVSAFVDKLDREYGDYVITVSNAAKEALSMQTMYSSLITIVAGVLFLIALFIILLILYVILHSMIVSLKTDFGIYKAMGFTSSQLMIQTVCSITPSILLGALASAIAGALYLPVMFNGIFGVIGAIKNNFVIPLSILLGTAVILTAVTMLIGVILCRPIRHITACSLITN